MKSEHLPESKMRAIRYMDAEHRRSVLSERVSILMVRDLTMVLFPAQTRAVARAYVVPSIPFTIFVKLSRRFKTTLRLSCLSVSYH